MHKKFEAAMISGSVRDWEKVPEEGNKWESWGGQIKEVRKVESPKLKIWRPLEGERILFSQPLEPNEEF